MSIYTTSFSPKLVVSIYTTSFSPKFGTAILHGNSASKTYQITHIYESGVSLPGIYPKKVVTHVHNEVHTRTITTELWEK